MLVNPDFSRRAVVTPQAHRWVASPQPQVKRMMLDRLGGEGVRATSLVHYEAGSTFPAHDHPGGEEILVLAGTFSDSSGHYGPGWYLRNPPGSVHQPSSAVGTLIFVKLWQMSEMDTHPVRVDTRDPSAWYRDGQRAVCPLHADHQEQVCLLRLPPEQSLSLDRRGGAELLVLEGWIAEGTARFDRGSWLRLPPGGDADFSAGAGGVTLYLKTGHLAAMIR